jgi:hypothetical protein
MILATFGGGLSAPAAEVPPLERIAIIPLKGPVGGLDHLSLDAKRGRPFVANTINGSLDVVSRREGFLRPACHPDARSQSTVGLLAFHRRGRIADKSSKEPDAVRQPGDAPVRPL